VGRRPGRRRGVAAALGHDAGGGHVVSAAAQCARVLLAQLIAQGVREIVLCPGSRSAPLALAAFDADAAGLARLHVRVDERSAGFLALGLAKASGAPAAVVTTSGTAVGNLLPAVMEAAHAGVGLLVVSADRPAALVGFGANQTTEQVGLFGGFVRYAARVTSAAHPDTWAAQAAKACALAGTGPVHLNVELDVPLVDGPGVPPASLPDVAAAAAPLRRHRPRCVECPPAVLPAGPRTVIVAGDERDSSGAAALWLAAQAGLPLIAEPSSNARAGRALRCGRLVLGTPLAEEVERVVVFGHPTLSRPVMKLLARPDVEVVVVAAADADWPDPGHRARLVAPAVALAAGDEAWPARWAAADAEASARVDAALAGAGLTGWSLAAAVWASCAGRPLVLGASQIIRDADLLPISARPPGVHANRGLAGIDGTVATALGVALAHPDRPTTLLCGDLTFLHDSNALAIGRREPRPDLRIVVADDAGGAIFATLEYGQERFAAPFERVFGTDPAVDLAALAASYGVPVTACRTDTEVGAALARPVAGIDVVVVRLERARRRALTEALAG